MELNEKMISELVARVVGEMRARVEGEPDIPIGVSNRHIHLTQADVEALFGEGYQLEKIKDLKQPGQYACRETLTIVGPSMRPIEVSNLNFSDK